MCGKHRDLVVAELSSEIPSLAGAIGSVVYYVGDPVSRNVKIGTSTNLRDRISKMRHKRPGAVVLATEPGNYTLERHRHSQFSVLSVGETGQGRREWFRNAPALALHVSQTRQIHGIIETGRPLHRSYIAPWSPPRQLHLDDASAAVTPARR